MIRNTLQERDYDSFVDSCDRPGKSAVEVKDVCLASAIVGLSNQLNQIIALLSGGVVTSFLVDQNNNELQDQFGNNLI